ncbi:synaptogenesis protein syg-1-like, partial [Saccoglossus kowalevskii]
MLVINQHNCYIIMNVVKYPLLYLLFAEVVCHVTSTSPHRIVIGPEETLAYNGETVVMKCTVASGLPTWFRVVPGGTDIELSDGTSAANPYQIVGDQSSGEYFLQIPNVQVSDSHTYQCALFNANPAYIQASLTVIARYQLIVKQSFACGRCKNGVGRVVEQEEKLCDEVETVKEFTYLGDK